MLFQAVLVTALSFPILSTCTHTITDKSDVFYFDQVPADAYNNEPTIAGYKDRIFVRKDISYLDPKKGPKLVCLPNGQVKLDFVNAKSALRLDELASDWFLSHPVIIPYGYDSLSCPELVDYTIFGPRDSVPEDSLADLQEGGDNYAIMIAVSEDDVTEQELTVSVDWADYHSLIGIVSNPPEGLASLAPGIFPFDDSSSTASTRVRKRRVPVGNVFKAIGKFLAKETVRGGTEWALDRVAKGVSDGGDEED